MRNVDVWVFVLKVMVAVLELIIESLLRGLT
jgi:hypothetical protein